MRTKTPSLLALALLVALPATAQDPAPEATPAAPAPAAAPSPEAAAAAAAIAAGSDGCLSCHKGVEDHHSGKVKISCVGCHGGNASVVSVPPLGKRGDPAYEKARRTAHVLPKHPGVFKTSANPVRSYTALNKESNAFVRFVNPGDFRVAQESCGSAKCHPKEILANRHNMMAHGAMLWQAALYNNGAINSRRALYGEGYTKDGKPARLVADLTEDAKKKDALAKLDPLPRWNVTQPGNVLRVFERGGMKKPEIGNPNIFEEPGAPEVKLSNRGFGTQLRTDPVFIGLQKTRLLDPTLNFLGTNDHPGDYRSSGCTACHMTYANDRDPSHSGPDAKFGNRGLSASADPTIPKDEPGHPIRHQLTNSVPSSQCMVCHVHPGTNVLTTYYGATWWDNETDGELMYPEKQVKATASVRAERLASNPEESSIRGKWGDPKFLESLIDLNPKLTKTRFNDFHGHGWVFRDVFKTDAKGNFLDGEGKPLSESDPQKLAKAVHLKDIHLEKGMHCVDCHFRSDNHGDGNLYGEVRAATAVECVDCHGTVSRKASFDEPFSGNAGGAGTEPMSASKTAFGERFKKLRGKLFQQSAIDPDLKWELTQVIDTITPGHAKYNEKSALAKTMQRDGMTWGKDALPADLKSLAHGDESMSCAACHSSWTPSCFGCHLPMRANEKRPMLHNEGGPTRNWTSYNFQTLRDDVYMIGRDGNVKKNKISPMRSSCAILVSSQDANRQWIYSQQQTISAEGLSGQAFSPFAPHTVRGKETKNCTDCHVSASGDNNAKMATLMMLGTNFYNFVGRYAWVAADDAIEAVVVTEREEPQAVLGSDLQKMAYPDSYRKHVDAKGALHEVYEHGAKGARSIQVRGEYAYVAEGRFGLRIYDIANIDNKGFSERITTAPVSPLGQKFYVRTKNATAVASPTTLGVDPTRSHKPDNLEPTIHMMYAYLYVTDAEEGLILVGAGTLLDGDPTNNFVKRALTWNPDGILKGASNITIAGTTAYICADKGLVIVSIDEPLKPKVLKVIGRPSLVKPRAVDVQFRYAFVVDERGLKVVDVTDPAAAEVVSGASVPIEDARDVYVVRTYAYVAAGKKGLAIVDVTKPEDPVLDQTWNADGAIDDAHQIRFGMTNNSLFGYLADGKNGLRVLQMLSPQQTPGIWGFSPRPTPKLIATRHTHGPALAVSEGLDRDRAVDESGNQLTVFGRRGARPLSREEMKKMLFVGGKLMKVTDGPPMAPRNAMRGAPTPPPAPLAREADVLRGAPAPQSADLRGAPAPPPAPLARSREVGTREAESKVSPAPAAPGAGESH